MLSTSKGMASVCSRARPQLCLWKQSSLLQKDKAYGSSDGTLSEVDQSVENSPAFKAIAPDHPPKMASEAIVPGKGPPPDPPVGCCMSGCANCVWIQYAEDLTKYYKDGGETALKELDKIENAGLKAFIKLEIGL